MYTLDGRKVLPNYGTHTDDKKLYLGLNQVPYAKDTARIGKGLCRSCISVERRCMTADYEIDLKQGKYWGTNERLIWHRHISEPKIPGYECSRQALLQLYTLNVKNIKIKLFYGNDGPIGTHFTISDSISSEGFGIDNGKSINTAQIHGFEDSLTQYVSKYDKWNDGVQQGDRWNTGTRVRNFISANKNYEINLSNQQFEYDNFEGRSGSKINPWIFQIQKLYQSKVTDQFPHIIPDYDIFLSLNRLVKDDPDKDYGAGLCRVCVTITE